MTRPPLTKRTKGVLVVFDNPDTAPPCPGETTQASLVAFANCSAVQKSPVMGLADDIVSAFIGWLMGVLKFKTDSSSLVLGTRQSLLPHITVVLAASIRLDILA